MAAKNAIKVLIDNKIITLGGYESEEYLQKVASYVNGKIEECKAMNGFSRLPQDTKSTMLALNIADDYFKAKMRADSMENDLEARDQEAYDVKHDLIASQIQIDKLKAEIDLLKSKNAALEQKLK